MANFFSPNTDFFASAIIIVWSPKREAWKVVFNDWSGGYYTTEGVNVLAQVRSVTPLTTRSGRPAYLLQ